MTTLLLVSLFLILYTFILYPALMAAVAAFFPKRKRPALPETLPSVSILVVVRNGEKQIESKIRNSLQLDYPRELLDVLVVSDGSTDRTAALAEAWNGRGVRFLDFPEGGGKISAINRAVPLCAGEILVFSDVDALLHESALKKLVSWFSDPAVGGVCGRKRVSSAPDGFSASQAKYLSLEDILRQGESAISSIASNEGKLYALRRQLFQPMPLGVMDDIMNAMQVIAQDRRFLFDMEAEAYIPVPSADPTHEIQRRRRIVNPSLRGMLIMRRIFNPFRHGIYPFILFSHKVMRRLAPFFLIALFIASAGVFFRHPFLAAFFAVQCLVLANAAAHHFRLVPDLKAFPRTAKLASAAYYFCLGNWGTLLAALDFLMGKQVTQWQPRKAHSAPHEEPASAPARALLR